jgi:hypothetical protein
MQLRSGNPLDKPAIDPKYLSDTDDLRLILLGLRLVRRIAGSRPFANLVAAEIWPGPDAQSDDDLASYVRRTANTVYHPVGTCKMSDDDTNAPIIMIGEKAAETANGIQHRNKSARMSLRVVLALALRMTDGFAPKS